MGHVQKILIAMTVVFTCFMIGENAIAAATCSQFVQGKIAWDYKGHKQWNQSNINNLCRGAERSREPAACFNRVMHGGVNYGGGTRWKWKNAIDLCKGSQNARATISCFENRIKRRSSWQSAIRSCNHLPRSHRIDHTPAGNYRVPPRVVHPRSAPKLSKLRIVTIQQKSTLRYFDAYESNNDFKIVTRPKQNNRSQQWEITPLGNDNFTLRQKSNGRYVDAHENAQKDFSLVTRTAQNNNTQRWIIKGLGNNLFTIQQKSNGRFVDAYESGKGDYDVVTRAFQNNNSQRWLIKPISSPTRNARDLSKPNQVRQWMIGVGANGSGYIYPHYFRKGTSKGPGYYNIKGSVIRRFLYNKPQGTWQGINLGWTDNASVKTSVKRAQWFFARRSKGNAPLRYGEPIAIGIGQGRPYIRYAHRNNGINLDWSKEPVYEWIILGGKSGEYVKKGKDWVTLYNLTHRQPLIYFHRGKGQGGSIGWPDSRGWRNPLTRIKSGGEWLYGKGEDVYDKGRDVVRKFEPKSMKLARFNNRRKKCKKRPDTCTNCLPPKSDVDLDRDGIPDLLEYNLAYKFFPKVILYGKKYDLDQAYLYRGYATPFIVRPIRGGQCKGNQCLELRLGITFLYDAGDNKDYANWGGHIGDSEMYTAVVKRNASWAQSRNNVNNWRMIRDFSSAHWGKFGVGLHWIGKVGFDSSVMKSYPHGVNKRITLHTSTMKHALYHSHAACERGATWQDACEGNGYNLSQYKDRKLQNIGDIDQHAHMDTTIEHPVCGVYDVWSDRGFGEDEKMSDYFTKSVNYKLGN